MKKAIALLLVCGITLCMVGCGGTSVPTQNSNVNYQNQTQQTTTENKPTETALTVNNIANYLTISSNVHDCSKKNVGGVWSAEGEITIKTSPKKRGDFNNVVIQVAEKRTGKGWEEYAKERTLEIPFDGKFEQTFDIYGYVFEGSSISTSPYIELKIVSVSGTFVEQ